MGGRQWRLEPAAFKRTRKRMTEEQLAQLVSHDSFLEYKRDKAAVWLASTLPQDLVDHLVAGAGGVNLAVSQVPDPDQRRLGLVSTFVFKAGPDGSALGKARRALEELILFSPESHLPASAILLNRLLAHVDKRAKASGRGSQGGATVAASVRSGLLLLAAMGFPIDASHISVDAGAPPTRKVTRERRSGSLPICFYCHFEQLAAGASPTFARFWARSLVCVWLFGRLRLVDVLRSTISLAQPDADGTPVVCIFTRFSKDGAPLDVYLRAEGFLGPWAWIQEHVEALAGRRYVLPAFSAPRGRAGDVCHATGWLDSPAPRVASAPHTLRSVQSMAALAPLSFSLDLWKLLGLAGHSGHGSPSDMGATLGPHAILDFSFFPVDEQEMGHWRRRAHARSGDAELPLDPALEAALAQSGSASPPGPPAAMSAQDASMRVRYTSGQNRQGRRTAQLRVIHKLVRAVREAISRFGAPWTDLTALVRGHNSDYSILHRLHTSSSS